MSIGVIVTTCIIIYGILSLVAVGTFGEEDKD